MAGTNVVIGYPNLIDRASLSGGAWRAGDLALSAIQDRRLARPARSADVAPASTQFTVDLGASTRVGIYALVAHSLSVTARWRVRLAATADIAAAEYDSGWRDVWPAVYTPDMLEFEETEWWSGTLTQAEIAEWPACTIVLPPRFAYGRYVRVEIDDQQNPAGYIDVPRMFLGPTWSPRRNASKGMTMGLEIGTQIEEARDGTPYADRRTARRVTGIAFDALTHDEAVGDWFDLARRAGIDREVLWVPNPYEGVHFIRRSYLGRFSQLDPVAFPDLAWRTTSAQITEIT